MILVVAVLGIVGTLLATLVTQFLTNRREREQAQRQERLDDKRWQRERLERQEQWNREDQHRLHKEQLTAYVELLGSTYGWMSALRDASPNTHTPDSTYVFGGAGERETEDWRLKARGAIMAIELFTTPEVRAKAWEIYATGVEAMIDLKKSDVAKLTNGNAITGHSSIYDHLQQAYDETQSLIRKELGIGPRE